MRTSAGVFASHELDKGTSVLLSTLADHRELWPAPGSSVCDLGCGAGPIAVWLATVCREAKIDAVDVNERALDLCRGNARRLDLNGISPCHPDSVPSDRRYDLIVSNPPIRIGKDALHSLLNDWLGRLSDHGAAVMVVGKNLGADSLATWLLGQGFDVNKLASKKGFRVFHVVRRQHR